MGLICPVDLDAFHEEEERRRAFRRLRRLRDRLDPPHAGPRLRVRKFGRDPDVLLAIDSRAMSSRMALLDVFSRIDHERVAVLSSIPLDLPEITSSHPAVADAEIGGVEDLLRCVAGIATVVSAGWHVPAGALGHALAGRSQARSIVVQHGMLLPLVAPLPPGAILAAWSEADGAFWRSGREDIEVRVTGSALLAQAARQRIDGVDRRDRPLFCGTLHGLELPRREVERVARSFCRGTGARYRPHPAEVDLISRVIHLMWQRMGIEFAQNDLPLLQVASPIVGIWSTAVLEAATAGLPAWVYHPDPPSWLEEVWSRYHLSRWGMDPTPASDLGAGDPTGRLLELIGAKAA